MANAKFGEVISVSLDQIDSNGDKISDVTVNLYGYERAEANAGTQGFAGAILETIKQWDDMNKKGKK